MINVGDTPGAPPLAPRWGSTAVEPPVSGHYRRLVNPDRRVRRMVELNASDRFVDPERQSLRASVVALYALVAQLDLSRRRQAMFG